MLALQSCPARQPPKSLLSGPARPAAQVEEGELMRWGKAGSCGARRLIRVVAMFVSLLTLSWEERLRG